jgi:hypothetical protein
MDPFAKVFTLLMRIEEVLDCLELVAISLIIDTVAVVQDPSQVCIYRDGAIPRLCLDFHL